MHTLTSWFGSLVTQARGGPAVPLEPLPARPGKKLWLRPEAFLAAIHGRELAVWALLVSQRLQPPRVARGPGGRPRTYTDEAVLLMAVVQTAWRMSYATIVDYLRNHAELAAEVGFEKRTATGQVVSISQGQYWERRAALGILPFLLFFIALVGQLVRLGVVKGHELLVDSSRLQAWRHADPGAAWSRYANRAAVFGYKVHTVLCRHAELPVFVLVTPASAHDGPIGLLILMAAVLIYGFRPWIVYADAAYFNYDFLGFIHTVLGASVGVDYNPRRKGKRALATPFFLRQWRRYVLGPRSAIERHFAWAKRYFGLKYFQCYTFVRVSQFVLLTYIVIAGVAVAAQRYQRPDLVRSRGDVLAVAVP